MYTLDDTIAAVSTPPQLSAIAVIRISGKKALEILDKIFVPRKPGFPPRFATTGSITDGEKTIDEVLAIKFESPNSYTGENMVEIHCHGSPFVTQKILSLIQSFNGTRLAERGEFTYRAFVNGKLDLTQAEAVLQVIESKSDLSLSTGLGQLKGKLSQTVKKWRNEIVDILSLLEAQIDHADDVGEVRGLHDLSDRLQAVISDMKKTLKKTGEYLTIDIPVVIVGKPNVGKSSLFNALAGEERVIVTHIAGTTTDIVSETLQWDGLSWKIHDTAGIGSEPADIIEKIGQDKTHRKLKESQVILFVIDASEPLDEKDIETARKIEAVENKLLLVVLNKSDKKSAVQETEVARLFKNAPKTLRVSAAKNEGIQEIKQTLSALCLGGTTEAGEILIGSLRQKRAVEDAVKFLENAVNEIGEGEEIAAHHIKMAAERLREILGEITTEEVLDEIFSKFCIGK